MVGGQADHLESMVDVKYTAIEAGHADEVGRRFENRCKAVQGQLGRMALAAFPAFPERDGWP